MMTRVVSHRHGPRASRRAATAAVILLFGVAAGRAVHAAGTSQAEGTSRAAGPAPSAAKESAPAAEKEGAHWSYEGKEGPDHWAELDQGFATCRAGKLQSPIDIPARRIKGMDLDSFHFFYKPAPLAVIDNGHTIQVNFEPGSFMSVGGVAYHLAQIHFHRPGEERIDGKSFPMVAHLVHRTQDGKLAVIAVLLARGAANPVLDAILANVPKDKGRESKPAKVTIDPAGLMPVVRTYYTFPGSLTTPPCTEGVTWFVLKNQATISAAQEETFAKRYPHNARPIQPAGGRKIEASE